MKTNMASQRLPALYYSVDYIFVSFEIMDSNSELWNH